MSEKAGGTCFTVPWINPSSFLWGRRVQLCYLFQLQTSKLLKRSMLKSGHDYQHSTVYCTTTMQQTLPSVSIPFNDFQRPLLQFPTQIQLHIISDFSVNYRQWSYVNTFAFWKTTLQLCHFSHSFRIERKKKHHREKSYVITLKYDLYFCSSFYSFHYI